VLVTVNTFGMNASLYRSIPYDPEKSFVPIAEIATGILALVIHPSLNVECSFTLNRIVGLLWNSVKSVSFRRLN
jgi:hypothetical protein